LASRKFVERYAPWISSGVIAVGGTIYFFLNHNVPKPESTRGFIYLLLAMCALLPVWIYQELRSSSPPLLLLGYVQVAWILVLAFSLMYWIISHQQPTSFKLDCATHQASCSLSHTDSIYLTLTVFTTTGFGDIAPVSPLARGLVSLQMCVSIVFFVGALSLVIGRLDSKGTSKR
jgi:voltage-gated potassium channel